MFLLFKALSINKIAKLYHVLLLPSGKHSADPGVYCRIHERVLALASGIMLRLH